MPLGDRIMIGQRIQQARELLNLSIADLSDLTELNPDEIKQYEDGEVTPSSDVLIKLGKALRVRIAYFFRPMSFSPAIMEVARSNLKEYESRSDEAFLIRADMGRKLSSL